MTKQGEIREGMSDILFRKGRGKWYKDEIINELLAFLHSQGVVVKVERELPYKLDVEYIKFGESFYIEEYLTGKAALDKTGYAATEPLI